jgi:Diacylglycerol kinase catalytic domain
MPVWVNRRHTDCVIRRRTTEHALLEGESREPRDDRSPRRRASSRTVSNEPTVDCGSALALPSEAIVVGSRHSGRSRRLARTRSAIDQLGIAVAEEVDIADVERLPQLLRTADGESRLVIAAGGDGTVGSVAGCLANTQCPLAILPLGTGNDFARALGIPMNPYARARLVGGAQITKVDLGLLSTAMRIMHIA